MGAKALVDEAPSIPPIAFAAELVALLSLAPWQWPNCTHCGAVMVTELLSSVAYGSKAETHTQLVCCEQASGALPAAALIPVPSRLN